MTISRRDFAKRCCIGTAAFTAGIWGRSTHAAGLPLSLAVIGCGRRGRSCLDGLRTLGRHRVRAVVVCDSDPARGLPVADSLQAMYIPDWRSCMEMPHIDGIVIAAPDDVGVAVYNLAHTENKALFWDCSNSSDMYSIMEQLGRYPVPGSGMGLFSPVSSVACTAHPSLVPEALGTLRYGRACARIHVQMADVHVRQVLLLLEAICPRGCWHTHTIGAMPRMEKLPANAPATMHPHTGVGKEVITQEVTAAPHTHYPEWETLMTEIQYDHGLRLEVTTTAKRCAIATGMRIRGDRGHAIVRNAVIERFSRDCGTSRTAVYTERKSRVDALDAWVRHADTAFCLAPAMQVARDISALPRRNHNTT